ncbi:DUF262 domain-containing protein [Streptomyces sp. NBC_01353]|uniref:DUF262 domain-containing protein n=1 Tax=Streptomyces sp. NBC_01353 TaxID=2903835 RepID=UPI002E32C3B4|nr:DUF262 domain-containing protein [Streptomyces sp. NBC_01353]
MALDKVFKRRGRYDIPDWQRDEVWTPQQKQLLIDSILSGWKLPKFYFAKTSSDPDEFDVVDGQQRLATIWEFFENKLRLSDESFKRFGGYTYSELPDALTDSFDDFTIQYDEITEATDDDIQEFFQRLQAGKSLTSAERLNSVNSNLTRFARKLSTHRFFKEKVVTSNTRKAYFDMALKAAAVEIEGLGIGLRYDELKALSDSQNGFSENSLTATRLVNTLDYLDEAFPEKSPFLRNRSTIQSIITLAANIVQTGKSAGTESRLHAFVEDFAVQLARQNELGIKATDTSYLDYQRTLSANVKSGAKDRHEILLRKLLISDPAWMEVMTLREVASSAIREEIDNLGRRISALISQKNEEYSAKHGSDLFKATTRTIKAMTSIREPVENFEAYSNFIGELYFTFREGPGSRLENSAPPSFVDVNLLRTGLQHDVDHGKSGAVAAKRRKIGEAFARYASGETSPSTLAPERFPLVQAALLQALADDLGKLNL